ncbi:MAG: hypothetical protein HOM96_04405 [Rickettsiales bacterium]|jgi:hypothetical protein|nr:hypothetical protein [Rickettsiales bacterium]
MSANIEFLALARKLSEIISVSDNYLSLSLILSIGYNGSLTELNNILRILLDRSDINRDIAITELKKILFYNNMNINLREKFDSLI